MPGNPALYFQGCFSAITDPGPTLKPKRSLTVLGFTGIWGTHRKGGTRGLPLPSSSPILQALSSSTSPDFLESYSLSSRQSNTTVPKYQVQLGLSPSLEGPKAHLGLSWGRKELLPPRKPPLHVSISIREIKCTPKKTFPVTAQVTGGRSRSLSALHKDSSDFLSSLLVLLSGELWSAPSQNVSSNCLYSTPFGPPTWKRTEISRAGR